MDTAIKATLSSLRSRGLNGFFAQNQVEARERILSLTPRDAVIGVGDSTTLRQISIIDVLKARGTNVLDPFAPEVQSRALLDKLIVESTICDVFLTGTNAITRDGRLVNVDSRGNRVAGMFHGHPSSIIVAGRNKIVANLEEAFYRVRKIIAPNHIKIRAAKLGASRVRTPCVATGVCQDCRADDRKCNVFTIIEGKPSRTSITVIIVDEDLGLGWDESWEQRRIAKIIRDYKKFVWMPLQRKC